MLLNLKVNTVDFVCIMIKIKFIRDFKQTINNNFN